MGHQTKGLAAPALFSRAVLVVFDEHDKHGFEFTAEQSRSTQAHKEATWLFGPVAPEC
jgi:hypothetical protein